MCRWCGQSAVCQTTRTQALRNIKSSPKRRIRQARPVGDNGYDQLDGKWLTYYKIASWFSHKAQAQDREDLLQDIMIALADVARNNGHKPISEVAMYRVASFTVAQYWRDYHKRVNGIDCGHCSNEQRRKCREDWLYSACPKYHQLVSLNTVVGDDGHKAELIEFLADDHAIDLADWLDARRYLQGFPRRIVQIGYKVYSGYPLDNADKLYLGKWRRKNDQIRLID